MWQLEGIKTGRPDLVEACLEEGYEPFAVSTDMYGFITIWFKRKVEDAVYSKPSRPVKRTSRRTTKDSKG